MVKVTRIVDLAHLLPSAAVKEGLSHLNPDKRVVRKYWITCRWVRSTTGEVLEDLRQGRIRLSIKEGD